MAHARGVTAAVLQTVTTWRVQILGVARALVIDWFGPELVALDPRTDAEARATVIADQLITGWIGQRAFLCDVVFDMLGAELRASLESVGRLGGVGEVVERYFDDATIELDAEMRDLIDDMVHRQRRGRAGRV